MSGFCGLVHLDGRPVSPGILADMAQAGIHRGLDGVRTWCDGSVGLTHLALHTTPEARSDLQPLRSRDGHLAAVADARIDNRTDLTRRLSPLLRRKEPTDTELILAAYERWGAGCPDHLRGDFAFVVWDARQRRLFGATDVFGLKSLHYAQAGQAICVASEAVQILRHPDISNNLDELSIAEILVGIPQYDDRSMFREVRRLAAGHHLSADSSALQVRRYWGSDLPPIIRYGTDEEYAEHFYNLFDAAVKARTRSSGKVVGVQMSGGLDSTSVAAMVHHQRVHNHTAPGLTAYTFAFDEVRECDERKYSNTLTEELGIDVVPLYPEQLPLLGDPSLIRYDAEHPNIAWEEIYRQLLQHLSARQGRVLLTGHGGDSIAYGSPLHYVDQLRRGQIRALFRGMRRHSHDRSVPIRRLAYLYLVAPTLPDSVDRALRSVAGKAQPWRIPAWITPDFARRVDLHERLWKITKANGRGRTARENIRRNIVDPSSVGWAIYWYGRLASRFGIEMRHPFLDRELADFVMATPPDKLYGAGQGKLLLRQAMAGLLPERIRTRLTKTEVRPYVSHSLRGEGKERVKEVLSSPVLAEMGILDPEALKRALGHYQAGRVGAFDDMIWSTITLELWIRNHRDSQSTSTVRPGVAIAG